MDCNRVAIAGKVVEKGELRHTPAGVPVLELKISHASRQMEAGLPRQVECKISAVALGEVASNLARLKAGDAVKLTGFLAKRSRASSQLILHVNNAEF